jgi:replication initiator protein RepSA
VDNVEPARQAALPGVPDTVDTARVIEQMVRRASSLGFESWWRRTESVGFCAHPIQLTGSDEYGRDRVVWTRCNNRRAQICPSCSDLYSHDTWQLVHAGCAGGHHDMPTAVADRPQVFATLTAPSFGPVHTATTGGDTKRRVCRDHHRIGGHHRCPHGKPLWCSTTHENSDKHAGQPLCTQCYEYVGHVLFTWHLPELWRRFTITLRRAISQKLKAAGVGPKSVRVSFVKVIEMQARAVPHVHALIRLDPADSDITASGDHDIHGPATTSGDGELRHQTGPAWQSPLAAAELAALIQHTARSVTLEVADPTADDPDETAALVIRFGTQTDTQPLTVDTVVTEHDSDDLSIPLSRLSPRRVAGYLAKYVTKSLSDFGIAARRLSDESIADLDVTEHVRTILTTISNLAQCGRNLGIDTLTGIGRWLHTLGYRGHITTKSRRYSTTMGKLRAIRATWTRQQSTEHNVEQRNSDTFPLTSDDQDVWWEFDRAGHVTLGDRTLVVSAALRHIHTRRTGLVEFRALRDGRPPGTGDG